MGDDEMIFTSANVWKQIPIPQTEKITRVSVKPFSGEDTQGLLKILDFDEMAYFNHYTDNDTPEDHWPPKWTLDELREVYLYGLIYGIYGVRPGNPEEEMIGFYIFERRPKGLNALYIGGLDIHPELRDIGLGSWVLNVAEITARQTEGIDRITLTVDPLNGRGVHTYLKHGFRIIDFKKDYFGPGTDRFWMEKQLKQEPTAKYTPEKTIECKDDEGLMAATRDGLIGIGFQRGQDNYHNKVIFAKLASR